jgi:hypothetical protein
VNGLGEAFFCLFSHSAPPLKSQENYYIFAGCTAIIIAAALCSSLTSVLSPADEVNNYRNYSWREGEKKREGDL